MLSRKKKIAVASGLLAGLIVTGARVAQAYEAESPGGCMLRAHGNVTCAQTSRSVHTSKDGRKVFEQVEDCSVSLEHRVVWPASGLPRNGTTKIGPVMGCSNSESLP